VVQTVVDRKIERRPVDSCSPAGSKHEERNHEEELRIAASDIWALGCALHFLRIYRVFRRTIGKMGEPKCRLRHYF
jgi:hypothetical protein